MAKKKNKVINAKARLVVWKIINVLVLIIPLTILVIVKRDVFFNAKTTTNNLTGLVLVAIFIIIALGKHADFLKGCWGGLIIFSALFFLRYILEYIVVIAGLFEVGVIISTIFTSKKVAKWERIYLKVETAKINANANADALELERILKEGK